MDLQDRLRYNRPVFRALQARLDAIPDTAVKRQWGKVIAILGSGAHPSANDVITCKPLFEEAPYSIGTLTYTHLVSLLLLSSLRSVKSNLLIVGFHV